MKKSVSTSRRMITLFNSIIFFFCTSTAFAQLSSSQIDILMKDALAKFNVAGAAIAIVKDGKIIHQKGYGVSSIETKIPVNENTSFQIGSNTKSFTAAAFAILVDEGKIKWTDKVKNYLPDFKMYDNYVTENFNIQDLLSHHSGLEPGAGDPMLFPDGSNFTVKDILSSLQYFKPVSDFRSDFTYNNLLYIVASEVIAKVSGMSYEVFVQKRILEPLQMNNTFFYSMMKDKNNLATPHLSESGTIKTIKHFDEKLTSGAGGVFSSVADMSKWMIMHLNKGNYGSDLKSTLISLNSRNEMWSLHTVMPAPPFPRYNTHFFGYGLGWGLGDMKGNLVVDHEGSCPGMISQVRMLPDLNLGIVILTNTDKGGIGLTASIMNTIVDSYLGLDDFGWTGKIAANMKREDHANDELIKNVWAKVDSLKNIKVKNENYVGIYEDKWFGKIEVFLKDKQLWIKCMRSPKLNGPMALYGDYVFVVKWEYRDSNCDALISFALDKNSIGQSIKMTTILPDNDYFQSLNFQKIDKE